MQQSTRHPITCINFEGSHTANYKNCPTAVKFAKGAKAKQAPVPYLNFRRVFPSLSSRPAPRPSSNANATEDTTGLKEILQVFTSGTIKTYITKFKTIISKMRTQTDPISKMITLITGLTEMGYQATL